jgi:hypothetical protein
MSVTGILDVVKTSVCLNSRMKTCPIQERNCQGIGCQDVRPPVFQDDGCQDDGCQDVGRHFIGHKEYV